MTKSEQSSTEEWVHHQCTLGKQATEELFSQLNNHYVLDNEISKHRFLEKIAQLLDIEITPLYKDKI